MFTSMAMTIVIFDVDIVAERLYFPVIRIAAAIHFHREVTTVIGNARDGHKAAFKIHLGDAIIHPDDFIIQATGQIDGYGIHKGVF